MTTAEERRQAFIRNQASELERKLSEMLPAFTPDAVLAACMAHAAHAAVMVGLTGHQFAILATTVLAQSFALKHGRR